MGINGMMEKKEDKMNCEETVELTKLSPEFGICPPNLGEREQLSLDVPRIPLMQIFFQFILIFVFILIPISGMFITLAKE
jgi:hypothetical protein